MFLKKKVRGGAVGVYMEPRGAVDRKSLGTTALDTPHSVGLLCTSDQPVAQTST
jgi:hypothetical protein